MIALLRQMEVPDVVRCDSSALQRIISNLVNNSVEAMKRPGSVDITLSIDPDCVTIRISDDGKGISQEQLAMLGPKGISFGKSGSSASGHGLGLSYAFTQVEAWGGKIAVSSQVDQGTTVTIPLPRVAEG